MMHTRNYAGLLSRLSKAYARYAPASAALQARAKQTLVDGGSHALRLIQPFPPRIASAQGAWLTDEDGHKILDFWQGHLANILGHNPQAVTSVLAQAFDARMGLQTGLTDRLEVETAEILCRQTGAERVRFTTSGSLATMYALMLARAFTGRNLIIKVGGGWHGAQPWGLQGIAFRGGFDQVESEGLPGGATAEVIVTRFNDPQRLCDQFSQFGDQVACFIVEPFLGVSGFIPAAPEYLQTARRLADQHGALLIFDEVISGFRFHPGDVGSLYGVRPDLATFGKIIGGGMPVAAVAGRADVMALVGRSSGTRVRFSGGTYSAHPASLLAALTLMQILIKQEHQIYPRLTSLGETMRRTIETAFLTEGLYARCTGYGNEVLPGSSMAMIHFPHRENTRLDSSDVVLNPSICDVTLSHQVLEIALLLEDVHMLRGHGAVSTAHTEADIEFLGEACRSVARLCCPYYQRPEDRVE
jgi:glutamate-1-semialdehyde 2,1-aminomutase